MRCGFVGGAAAVPGGRRVAGSKCATRHQQLVTRGVSGSDLEIEKLKEQLEQLKKENEVLKSGGDVTEVVAADLDIGEIGEEGREVYFQTLLGKGHPLSFPVLGRVEDLTAEDFRAGVRLKLLKDDPMWLKIYEPLGEGSGKFMATDSTVQFKDPVKSDYAVVIAKSSKLGLAFPATVDPDVYVVVDMAESALEFETGKFFVWETNNRLDVGYLEELPQPEEAKPIAHIVLTQYQSLDTPKKKQSFAELGDDFEF